MGFWDNFTGLFKPAPVVEKAMTFPAGLDLTDSVSITQAQATYKDPFQQAQAAGYRVPTRIPNMGLRMMVERVPLISTIVQTRLNQISHHLKPVHHPYETGFRIKMRDIDGVPTKAERKEMAAIEQFILRGGNGDENVNCDTFETFVRKVMFDSLVYDQLCFEILRDEEGLPARWVPVDGSTIFLLPGDQVQMSEDLEADFAVQVVAGVPKTKFCRSELAFEVRNPRTDLMNLGYGWPELQQSQAAITQFIFATEYNANAFRQGSTPKGMVSLSGHIPQDQLLNFKRNFYQMLSGAQNAHRVPIINAPELDMKWVPMLTSNREMEYSAYMDFLIKSICGNFQMDPLEINFKYGNQGGKTTMEAGTRSKVTESKDRGLKPLLNFLARVMNKHIVQAINPKYTLEFVGLEPYTPKELADLVSQRTSTYMTINEARAEMDLPPLKGGDIIRDVEFVGRQTKLEDRSIKLDLIETTLSLDHPVTSLEDADQVINEIRQSGAAGSDPSKPE